MKHFNLKKLFKQRLKNNIFDGARNNVQVNGDRMRHYWERFIQTQGLCKKYNKNSEEYKKLNKLCWLFFGKYMDLLLSGYTEALYGPENKRGKHGRN